MRAQSPARVSDSPWHRSHDLAVDLEGNETRVIHELVDFSGKNVLEIGGGDGRLIWRYADRAASVVGLDPFERDIEQACSATPDHVRSKVRFRICDAVTADFAPRSFDIVVLGRCI
jgi:ubiquinone/menaquinone biosynthesis C-methylase UbiE